jgi:predicted amidohydrolase YtcJ
MPADVRLTDARYVLADLVVLSDDIFTIPPEAIEKTRVDMTVFDG